MIVSVVIPVYNAAPFIARCARSLFMQSFDDVEYIFVDDGCTDESIDILRQTLAQFPQLESRVRIIAHDTNRGSAMARSTGMHAATGDYIIQVDSDDYVLPHYLSSLVEVAQREQAQVTICNYYVVHNNVVKPVTIPQLTDATACLCKILTGEVHNGLWNKLIKRQLIVDNDIYPVEGINMYDDKSVMFRVMYFAERVAYLDQALYYYNKANPQSITAQRKEFEIDPASRFVRLAHNFFATHQASPQVTQALDLFKMGAWGLVLLYGDAEQRNNLRPLLSGKHSISMVMHQQLLPSHYRIAVALDKLHLSPCFSWLYKLIRRSRHHGNSK